MLEMLADRDNLLQRCHDCGPLACNGQALDSSRRPGRQRDAPWRNVERTRDQPDQLGIRLPLACRCAHPGLEDAASVREHRNAVNGVAAAAWSEPNRQRNAAWHYCPGPRRRYHSAEPFGVEPIRKLLKKHQSDDQNSR